MKQNFISLILISFLITVAAISGITVMASESNPLVKIETNLGEIVVELYPKEAPETVKNFIAYIESGFYNNTIFHRVIKGFMIQGGGFTKEMVRKPVNKPIMNEADNGLSNLPGTIAMARTSDPHSASSQFFINVAPNSFLDHQSKTQKGWGYCVFGKVISGMDIVNIIVKLPTTINSGMRDVPVNPVIINKIVIDTKNSGDSV